MQQLSWDDFRLVKAIADMRSLGGAAESLGLNHSTIFRRLNALEEQLGSRVFERSRGGYGLTPAGEEMVLLAARMGEEIVDFERKVAGRDVKPTGELRVTTTDTVFAALLGPICVGFRTIFPDIRLDVIIDNRALNLSKRDADVAIRASREPPETLVGRRIASIAWAAYGSTQHCGEALAISEKPGAPWIGFGEPIADIAAAKWMQATIPGDRIGIRLNTVGGIFSAVCAGLGIGMLPCFLGDRTPGLARAHAPITDNLSSLWLLTHQDLRQSARVRAFLDHAARELTRQRGVLEGTLPHEA